MIPDYLTLGLVVIINIVLIIQIFTFTRDNTKDTLQNRVIINTSEVLVLLATVILVIYQSIRKVSDVFSLWFIIGLSSLLVICVWSMVRFNWLRTLLGLEIGISEPENRVVFGDNSDDDESDEVITLTESQKSDGPASKPRSDKDFVVFSKYIDKTKANNFSFEELYPDYNSMSLEEQIKVASSDYSAYNGYPDGHICKGCECLKHDDGYEFCGKFIPGMGTIGCSCRWGCLNCKKCGGHDCDIKNSIEPNPFGSSTENNNNGVASNAAPANVTTKAS